MSDYSAADLVRDLIASAALRIDRRNRLVEMAAENSKLDNFLLAELVTDDYVALAVGYRAKDSIVTGEAVIPRKAWSVTVFRAYAEAMRNGRPH